jgi:DNA modification methylase
MAGLQPVDIVADAIKDCSRRAAIVFDPFGGSGTTMVAAQKSGRLARLAIEEAYRIIKIREGDRVEKVPETGSTVELGAAERRSRRRSSFH